MKVLAKRRVDKYVVNRFVWDIFEAACSEPDSLAEGEEIEECEEFLLLACEVYEERNEDGGIYDRFREEGPLQPGGEPVDEEDSRFLRSQYPRLWEKYCDETIN